MYEQFTDRARQVMQRAGEEAVRFGHEYVGTEHVLLGLVAEVSGVAANVFINLGVDLLEVRREIEAAFRTGPGGEPGPMGRLPRTPRTHMVLAHAAEEARILNQNFVGTEHLLLGLLRDPDGVAARVLMNLGLTLETVRGELVNLGCAPRRREADPAPDLVVGPPTESAPSVAQPGPLTDEQQQLIRDRIRNLTEQLVAFAVDKKFVLAARCRDEADALTRLVAWSEWANRPR